MRSLHQNFKGLRWSDKIGHCGCPLALDTYWACDTMKCLYCPAHWDAKFSKCGFNVPTHITHSVRDLDLRSIFMCTFNGYGGGLNELFRENVAQFTEYIFAKKFIQLGNRTDPFIEAEKEFKITLAMLRFFHHQAVPTMISTKATWWAKDYRYQQVLAANPDNWHVKISISSLDAEQSAEIEPGVPSPEERLKAIETLSGLGVPVTLWIRPFIPGHSDDSADELVTMAAAAGAKAVSVEWLTLLKNPKDTLAGRYDDISAVLGYPLHKYYQEGSEGTTGPLRLTASLKRPMMEKMRDVAHKNGLSFVVSDLHNKDLSDLSTNCCGSERSDRFIGSSHTCAVQSKLGDVGLGTLDLRELQEIFGYRTVIDSGILSCDSKRRSKYKDTTIFEYLCKEWDELEGGDTGTTAIHRLYGNELTPAAIDARGHRVYRRLA